MAAGRRHQNPNKKIPAEEIVKILISAIRNGDDFVLTWEPRPGEEPDPKTGSLVQILTGNLITPCRLSGLMGRVALYEEEGARIITIKKKDLVFVPEK